MEPPSAYELYQSGLELLEQGDAHAASLPLRRARDLEPDTAMVREALGRALFGAQRYREAAEEFSVLVGLEPLNDFGQFCLGRALQLQGLHAEARPPLTLAALLQPDRSDYRVYRDRTLAALDSTDAPPAETDVSLPPRRSGAGPWGAPEGDVTASGPEREEPHPSDGDGSGDHGSDARGPAA